MPNPAHFGYQALEQDAGLVLGSRDRHWRTFWFVARENRYGIVDRDLVYSEEDLPGL